jgi:predicted RNA-binding Zn-ribbon protein involved in translation (DUF1610 family)
MVKDGEHYIIQNVRVRQYLGQKFLSSFNDTTFNKITEDLPQLSPDVVKEATALLRNKEIECAGFRSVEIIAFHTCVSCGKKVPFRQDAIMLKCDSCRNYCLKKNSPKTTSARVSLNGDDTAWYNMCSTPLEQIVEAYKKKYVEGSEPSEVGINEIQHDKLSEMVLVAENMKLTVKNDNVVSITFV